MKHTFSVFFLSSLLSLPVHAKSNESTCCSATRTPENSFVESVADKYDCAFITFKIQKPPSEQDWSKIIALLQDILNQYKQKGQSAYPSKVIKDIEAVLEEIFALDDTHGEITIEFALEKCPCENKAKCGENCDCGAIECKEMQVTKGSCCSYFD